MAQTESKAHRRAAEAEAASLDRREVANATASSSAAAPSSASPLSLCCGHWDALPPAILRQALARVSRTDAPAVRLVSRWWAENFDGRLERLAPRALVLGRTVARFPNLAALDTTPAAGRTLPRITSHEELVQVRESLVQLTELPQLTDLNLAGVASLAYRGSCMGVDCAVLASLAVGMPSLTRLSLADCQLVRPLGLTVLQPLSRLTELDMQGNDQLRDTSIGTIVQTLPSLQRLGLRRCNKLTDTGIMLLSDLPHLEATDVTGCPLVHGSFLSRLERLTELTLSGNYNFPHWGSLPADMPMPCLPRLRKLDLSNCRLLSDISMLIVWPKLTSLTSLNISGCPGLSDLALSMVSRLGTITELDISGLHLASDFILNHLTIGLLDLKSLKARGCKRWTNEAFMNISRLFLHHLDIRDVPDIDHRGVHLLGCGRIGRNLQELHMNAPNIAGVCLPGAVRAWYKLRVLHMDCRSLGAEQLAEVAGCLHPTLTELRLDCPTHLGEETLAALAAALPRLDSLHLGATPHLTRLAHLSRLGALTSLGLQDLPNVTEPHWGALGPLPSLRRLALLRCDGLEDASFRGLGRRMPALHSLALSGSTHVGDGALAHLSHCTSLSSLDLQATAVTDGGLQTLVDMSLQHLDLHGCDGIDSRYQAYGFRVNSSAGLQEVMVWISPRVPTRQ